MTILIVNNYPKDEEKYLEKVEKIEKSLLKLGESKFVRRKFSEIDSEPLPTDLRAVILSGSDVHLSIKDSIKAYNSEIELVKNIKVPILGICFGHQLIGLAFGGEIHPLQDYIKDFVDVRIVRRDEIFASWKEGEMVKVDEYHKDHLLKLPENFVHLAESKSKETCIIEAIKHKTRLIYGIQGHIERWNEENPAGLTILRNFLNKVVKKAVVLERISARGTTDYVDLPKFLSRFSYPVSLDLSKWVGSRVYEKGFADPLEFLCMLVNKFYTSINSPKTNILESFILNEGKSIEEKTKAFILTVKKWKVGVASCSELADAITRFCKTTYAVKLPMASFFLRMMLPEEFGTVDFRSTDALKSLGFEMKELPKDEIDKGTYLERYNGFDYLDYNKLITEIGKHYQVKPELGVNRDMNASEVDMALYEYGKTIKKSEMAESPAERASSEEKIQRIMAIAEKIVEGTRTGPPGIKKAGEGFLKNMETFANNKDIDSMFRYCTRLTKGAAGRGVAGWLSSRRLPSIESEYEKIRSIYYG